MPPYPPDHIRSSDYSEKVRGKTVDRNQGTVAIGFNFHNLITLDSFLFALLSMAAQAKVPVELIRYKLTLEDIALFTEHKQEWQDADRKQRQVIASKVYVKWKASNSHWDNEEKKLKKEVWSLLNGCFLLLNTW